MPRWIQTLVLAGLVGTVLGIGLGFWRSSTMLNELEELDVGAMEPLENLRAISEKETGMPSYQGAKVTPFSEGMRVQGVPVATGWFTAHDPLDVVQVFYERRLAEAGIPLVSKRFPNGIAYVGYKDIGTDLMHTVTLVPDGQKSTMVFVSTSSALDVIEGMKDTKIPEGVPHPPGATHTTVMEGGLGKVGQKWLSATVPTETVSKVLEFYRKGFVENGWAVSESRTEENGDSGWLRAAQGSTEARVSLRQDRLSTTFGVQLFVLLTDTSQTRATSGVAAN